MSIIGLAVTYSKGGHQTDDGKILPSVAEGEVGVWTFFETCERSKLILFDYGLYQISQIYIRS